MIVVVIRCWWIYFVKVHGDEVGVGEKEVAEEVVGRAK